MSVALLKGVVKNYDWGGYQFIPYLLKEEENAIIPKAEYWLGVHPQGPGELSFPNGVKTILADYVNADKVKTIGVTVQENFGTLPYLLKALDVKDMLSIQVHPTKANAVTDFAKENETGIPLDAPNRNYKDDNHKPELMVAMGEFWLLHGFKPAVQLLQTLAAVPELNYLIPVFEQGGYALLYKTVMEYSDEELNERLQPLLARIIPLFEKGELPVWSADYWAAKGAVTFAQEGKTDRGIFSVYFFNLVRMKAGEAVFQDAGVPHAYLQGQNIEIMASSDNVLRGGLTKKYIDVPELLKHTKTEATYPHILKGELVEGERIYKTPAPDFELSQIALQAGEEFRYTPVTTDLLLLTEGVATVKDEKEAVTLLLGTPSAAVFPGNEITIKATSNVVIYRATVPV